MPKLPLTWWDDAEAVSCGRLSRRPGRCCWSSLRRGPCAERLPAWRARWRRVGRKARNLRSPGPGRRLLRRRRPAQWPTPGSLARTQALDPGSAAAPRRKDGCGNVFEFSPSGGGNWIETVLHNFTTNPKDGRFPYCSLVFDTAGNLYGMTSEAHPGKLWSGVRTHALRRLVERKNPSRLQPQRHRRLLPLQRPDHRGAGNLYGTIRPEASTDKALPLS